VDGRQPAPLYAAVRRRTSALPVASLRISFAGGFDRAAYRGMDEGLCTTDIVNFAHAHNRHRRWPSRTHPLRCVPRACAPNVPSLLALTCLTASHAPSYLQRSSGCGYRLPHSCSFTAVVLPLPAPCIVPADATAFVTCYRHGLPPREHAVAIRLACHTPHSPLPTHAGYGLCGRRYYRRYSTVPACCLFNPVAAVLL